MTISQTTFHTLRVVQQIMGRLVQMQADMNGNARTWIAMANAQNPDVATLAKFMTDSGTEYNRKLAEILTYKNTNPNWPAVVAMFTAMGGVPADAVTLYTQLKAIADGIGSAQLTSYAQIITACNQITAAVQMPDSVWFEG